MDLFNNIYNKSKDEYFKQIDYYLDNNIKKFIITLNPETINYSEKNNVVKEIILNRDNDIVPDGISIVKAMKIKKMEVIERIAGIDIASYLINKCNTHNKSLYLFGASSEVLDKLVNKIKNEYPNIKLLGYTNGYVKDKDKEFKKIIKLKPDVCLVALGIPNQELLINKYIDKFDKGIFVGVGGSFDVLSGTKKRAPKILIKLNLEWLYRIIKEPKRIKRFYNSNIKFMINIRKK